MGESSERNEGLLRRIEELEQNLEGTTTRYSSKEEKVKSLEEKIKFLKKENADIKEKLIIRSSEALYHRG